MHSCRMTGYMGVYLYLIQMHANQEKTAVRVFELEEKNKELQLQNSSLVAEYVVIQERARRDSSLAKGAPPFLELPLLAAPHKQQHHHHCWHHHHMYRPKTSASVGTD